MAKLVFGQLELLEDDHFKGTVQVYDSTAGKVTTKVEKDFVWKAEKLASFVEALATSVAERLGPPSQLVVVFPPKIPRVDVSVDGELLFSPARGYKSTELKPGKHTIRLAIVQGGGAPDGQPSPADFLIGKAEYPFELAPGTVQAFVCDTFLAVKVSCDQSSAAVPAYRPPDFDAAFSALNANGRPTADVWSTDEKAEKKARKAVLKTRPEGWTTYCAYLALSSEDWEVKEDALKSLRGQDDPFAVAAAAHIAGFYSGDDVEDAALGVLKNAVPGRSDQYGEMINYYATMNPDRAKKLRKLLE